MPASSLTRLQIVFLALCLAIVAGPLLMTPVHFDKSEFGSGPRTTHPFPQLDGSLASWTAFPAAFEAFYNDYFRLRGFYMRLYALAMWNGFHVSPSSKVLVGRDGWLYYNDVTDNDPIATYQGTNLLTDDQVAAARSALIAWRDWLQARGIAFVVCVAPEKTSIYPEYLPTGFATHTPRTRIDQLLAACAGPDGVEIVDLRGPLLQAKQSSPLPLYFRTDTHWNAAGAAVGASVLLQALHSRLPAIAPLTATDFPTELRPAPPGDHARMIGVPTGLRDWTAAYPSRADAMVQSVSPERGKVVVEQDRPGLPLPRALFFRDSFASGLIPFLSPDFSRAVYIWDHQLDPRLIEAEKPNVVVLEMVERYFSRTVDLLPPDEVLRRYPKSFYLP